MYLYIYTHCVSLLFTVLYSTYVCFILYFTCMELRLVSFLLNEYVMLCYVILTSIVSIIYLCSG